MKLHPWEQKILAFLSGVLGALSLLGIYLAKTKPPEPYGHLIKAGHSHGLCFVFASFFYLALLRLVGIPARFKKILAYLVIVSFLEPFGLLWAGVARQMKFLPFSSAIGGGSFIVLWFLMAFLLLTKTKLLR